MQLPYHFEEETEYFGFIPATFTDEIVDSVNEAVFQMTDKLHKEIKELYPQISQVELDQGIQKLAALLERNVDKNFDILELYLLRNIFRFPSEFHTPLNLKEEDYNQVKELDRELKLNKTVLFSQQVFQSQLEKEIEKEEKCIEELQKLHEELSLLYTNLGSESFENITSSLVTQVDTLKNIVYATFKCTEAVSRPMSKPNDESVKEFNTLMQQKEMMQIKLKEEKTELYKISDPDALLTLKNLVCMNNSVA